MKTALAILWRALVLYVAFLAGIAYEQHQRPLQPIPVFRTIK